MSFALEVYRIPAYANYGRWVVSCPRCPYAVDVDQDTRTPVFECLMCGLRAEIEWPSEEMIYGIERLLGMRVDFTKRNWLPGETLIDLVTENAQHGVFDELPGGFDLGQFVVEDHRIRVDTLPITSRRLKVLGA